MTAPAAAGAPPAWHDDAERLGPALDRAAAVLVVGRDGDAAAWAALGAARAQSARRRVAVADLVGDAPALAALGDPDDLTGVSDSFFYGVSLNRIARAVDADGQLYVLPSGSEPVAVAEVLTSDRWRRLVAGFRDAGALLLLAARADAPGLDVLAGAVDGLVVVGDLGGLLPDAPPPLMVIPGPSAWRGRGAAARAAEARADADVSAAQPRADGAEHAAAPANAPERSAEPPRDAAGWVAQQQAAAAAPAPATPTDAPAVADVAAEPVLVPAPRRHTPGTAPAVKPPRRLRDYVPLALGVAALIGVAAIAVVGRRSQDAAPPAAPRAQAASRAQAAPGEVAREPTPPAAVAPAPAESIAAPAAPAAGAAGALAVANPADSARAAAYAVYLVGANTPDGATLDGVDQATLPVLSLTPVPDAGAPWWRLLAGAHVTRAGADALLADLRRRGVLGASSGVVVRAPYALLVADRLPAAQAPARVEALGRRGVPTYPLSRGDGTVALFAGAFERPGDAEYLATALRAAGVPPVLVYRTGGQ